MSVTALSQSKINSGFHTLLLSGVRGDTRRYRIFHLYQQLRLAGQAVVLSDITDPAILRHAAASDRVIIHRAAYDKTVRGVMERVRANRGIVLADTDDLIFDSAAFEWIDSPDFADPVRERLYRGNMLRQCQTLQAADAVLVSTGYLAEAVQRLDKAAWVHRNAFSLELAALSEQAYRTRRKDPDRVVIGYASGTLTHNRDFALVQPALKVVLERFPQAELHLMGALNAAEDWGRLAGRVHRFPLVPWRELPGLLAQLDINLAPLVTGNPFAQSKSEIKYMEAGLVGAVTIASPSEAYRHAIQPGKNGLLAGSENEWIDQLAGLIADPDWRQSMAQAARQDILANYSPQVRAAQLGHTLGEIIAQLNRPQAAAWSNQPVIEQGQTGEPFSVPASVELHPTLMEMGVYFLRIGAFMRLAGMIWVQFRRLLAPLFPFKKRGDPTD